MTFTASSYTSRAALESAIAANVGTDVSKNVTSGHIVTGSASELSAFSLSEGSTLFGVRVVLTASVPAAAAGKVAVQTASTTVLAANPVRVSAIFTNDSDTTIFLRLGSPAVMNEGVRLNSKGGSFEITSANYYNGVVSAITSAPDKNLAIEEH